MAPNKSLSLLFIFLSILVVLVPNEASSPLGKKEAIVGGWKPIKNLKDPTVVKIANFAVTEHNKQTKSTLTFVNVVKGETQAVHGTNYRLVISAKDGAAAAKNYRALVWTKPWQKLTKLVSFEEVHA